MTTTFRFVLPFPLLELPGEEFETEGISEWQVDIPPRRVVLPTKLSLKLLHHDQPLVMERLGWSTHKTGNATATYTGDSKGLFAITEVEATVVGLVVAALGDPVLVIYPLVAALNSFIEQHTAATATLWTPRATPQDIIGLEVATTGPDGREQKGMSVSFGNRRPVAEALAPLMQGAPPLYSTLGMAWNTLWGRTMLDSVREFMAVRPVRASQLAAIGFEGFLNSVLIRKNLIIEGRTLREKGEDLLGPFVGGGLNSKKAHGGEVANAWMLALAGRNALLHREQHQFEWTTVEGSKRRHDVSNLIPAGMFIAETVRLVAHVQARTSSG